MLMSKNGHRMTRNDGLPCGTRNRLSKVQSIIDFFFSQDSSTGGWEEGELPLVLLTLEPLLLPEPMMNEK